jgi:hypothetical protein
MLTHQQIDPSKRTKDKLLVDLRRVESDSIAAKLREVGEYDLANKLEDCHSKRFVKICRHCRKETWFWNRCDRIYCPICAPKISWRRFQDLQWFASKAKQPKHVVLTHRNDDDISPKAIARHKKSLGKLRRSKFAEKWRGGCWAMEVTNEERGWHIHWHLLVDADWIDGHELGIRWRRVTDEHSHIVKVKDVRDKDYLHEVTRYAVKGSDLASWKPADIASFIQAITRQRTWGVFGSFFKMRNQWKKEMEEQKEEYNQCECGNDTFKFLDELDYESQLITGTLNPPPPRLKSSGDRDHPIDADPESTLPGLI